MALKTGLFRLADPSTSFELEANGGEGEFVTGATPVTLSLTDRVKKALRIGLLIRVDESGETSAGTQTATYTPGVPLSPQPAATDAEPKSKTGGK